MSRKPTVRGERFAVFKRLWAVCILALAMSCMVERSQAQELVDPSWTGDPPETVLIVIGYDWTGMSADEQSDFWSIMHPMTNEEYERTLTPDEVEQRHRAMLAFANPDEYARLYPRVQKTPDQIAEEQFSLWAITHPDEYSLLVEKLMSPEELQASQVAAWVISHPVEVALLHDQSKTPEQVAADKKAADEAMHPPVHPKPIYATVPITEAATLQQNVNPQP